jgi:hypothetical protein
VVEADELWGGTLLSVAFDPVAWTLQFEVVVLAGEELRRYELTLDGVTEWHSSRSVPLPWNYAELTEIHISAVSDHQLRIEMVLWADDTSLSVRCERARLDRLA